MNLTTIKSELSIIDRFKNDDQINGRFGTNRNKAEGQLIEASDDLDAIVSWLGEYKDSPETFRSYKKEIMRLLYWIRDIKQVALSSLMKEDIKEYLQFLEDPHPSWCGEPMSHKSGKWKPLAGPLSKKSIDQAQRVIRSAFSYLCNAGYLMGNPVALIKDKRKGEIESKDETVERYIEIELWEYVWGFIEREPESTLREREKKARLRFIFTLIYLLGLRGSEAAKLQMNCFRKIRGSWWCEFVGKGGKLSKLPVSEELMNALVEYRRILGLSTDYPSPDELGPVVRDIKGKKGISYSMIYKIVKDVFRRAATELEETSPELSCTLRKASTHWIRHTAISHLASKGLDIHQLKRTARHSDYNTTSRYIHDEDDALRIAVGRLSVQKEKN